MTQPTTKFTEAYGYRLIVLWVTTLVISIFYYAITGWPNVLFAMTLALTFQFLLSIFGFPVAAVASFVIGGGIWRVLKGIIPNNTIRASLGGGVTGASVISLLVYYEIIRDPWEGFIYISAFFILGAWSGWAGERIAKRHCYTLPQDGTGIAWHGMAGGVRKHPKYDV